MRTVTVTAVGNTGVGKTTLFYAQCENRCPGFGKTPEKKYDAVTGFEYFSTPWEDYLPPTCDGSSNMMVDGKPISLTVRDTSNGGEEPDKFRPLSYIGADVALLCFAINDPQSFENIRSKWAPEIQRNLPEAPMILVGLKLDLRDDTTEIEKVQVKNLKMIESNQGDELAKELKLSGFKVVKYMEASAVTQVGLMQLFEEAIRCVISSQTTPKKEGHRHDNCSVS